jgi:hypothetical protein
MILKLFADNPEDASSSTGYDQIEFGTASDSSGTGAAAISGVVDVDTTTKGLLTLGYTTKTITNGSASTYYSYRYKNSVTAAVTDWHDWVKGGQDRWDDLFMKDLNDTAEAVWSSTDKQQIKQSALEALWPEFFMTVIDTSLTIVNNSTTQTYVYTVPHGIFAISEVAVGNINQTALVNRNFSIVKQAYWKFENNQLRFESLSGLTDTYPIRLTANKKYTSIGEIPYRLDELVKLHMRMGAYLKLADDYPRFLKWGQLQQGSKVSFENLRVHAREYERKFNDLKKQLKDSPMASLR